VPLLAAPRGLAACCHADGGRTPPAHTCMPQPDLLPLHTSMDTQSGGEGRDGKGKEGKQEEPGDRTTVRGHGEEGRDAVSPGRIPPSPLHFRSGETRKAFPCLHFFPSIPSHAGESPSQATPSPQQRPKGTDGPGEPDPGRGQWRRAGAGPGTRPGDREVCLSHSSPLSSSHSEIFVGLVSHRGSLAGGRDVHAPLPRGMNPLRPTIPSPGLPWLQEAPHFLSHPEHLPAHLYQTSRPKSEDCTVGRCGGQTFSSVK